jgi:hypothetical protein
LNEWGLQLERCVLCNIECLNKTSQTALEIPLPVKTRQSRNWHRLQTTESKRLLNTALHELKQLFNNNKNDCIQTFLQALTPTKSTDCSLWKTNKKIEEIKTLSPTLKPSQGTWARSNVEKAHAFAENLAIVIQTHPSEN